MKKRQGTCYVFVGIVCIILENVRILNILIIGKGMIWPKKTVNDCQNCHWQEVDNLSDGSLESDSVCSSQADLNWSEILDNMERCSSFNELHQLVSKLEMPQLLCNLCTEMLENEKDMLDYVALHHLPADAPDSFTPIKIYGDGNCFPRCLSYLIYGHENSHVQMRIKIVTRDIICKKHTSRRVPIIHTVLEH